MHHPNPHSQPPYRPRLESSMALDATAGRAGMSLEQFASKCSEEVDIASATWPIVKTTASATVQCGCVLPVKSINVVAPPAVRQCVAGVCCRCSRAAPQLARPWAGWGRECLLPCVCSLCLLPQSLWLHLAVRWYTSTDLAVGCAVCGMTLDDTCTRTDDAGA